MAWFPWPDSIKTRACRYLLQHYLGQFLEEKLKLEQLSFDLFDGKGTINDVFLDVFAINEKLIEFNVPFELTVGKIQRISVSVPWSAILNENSVIEVYGLEMVFQPRYTIAMSPSGMTESFYNSLQNMTTSMELAQQCFSDQQEKESGKLFEGLELFSQMIETVLAKINVTITNIKLRFECLPNDGGLGTALETHIDVVKYFDESGAFNAKPSSDNGESKGSVKMVSLSVASKCLVLGNISLFLDQFNCHASMESEFSKVKLGNIYGEQQLKLHLQKSETSMQPKLDTECYFGVCCFFLAPKQLPLLFKLAKAFIAPDGVNIDEPSVVSVQGSKTAVKSMDTQEFFSLEDAALLQEPLQNVSLKSDFEEYKEVDIGDSNQFHSVISTPDKEGLSTSFEQNKETCERSVQLTSRPLGPDSISFHCDLKISALIIHILHKDPVFSTNGDQSAIHHAFQNFSDLANFHFDTISDQINIHTDFMQSQDELSKSCHKFTHLRLLAKPVYVDLQKSYNSLFNSTKATAGIGNLLIQECFETKVSSSNDSGCHRWLVSDLLRLGNSQNVTSSDHLTVNVNLVESDKSSDSNIEVTVPESSVEVDLSIVNRLSSLLSVIDELLQAKSPKHYTDQDVQFFDAKAQQALFQHIIADTNDNCVRTVTITVLSKKLQVVLAFPIPDLRSDVQTDCFSTKHLRPDKLHLNAVGLKFSTNMHEVTGSAMETTDFYIKMNQILVSYSDDTIKTPLPFLQASKGKGNSDLPHIHIKRSSKYSSCDYENVSKTGNLEPTHNVRQEFYVRNQNFQKDTFDTLPTPFSQRRVIYNNEELKRPGNPEEMQHFIQHCTQTSQFAVHIKLPTIVINFPCKDVFENIYNRLCNDLVLWQPSPVSPSNTLRGSSSNVPLHFLQQVNPDPNMFYSFETHVKESQFESDDEDDETPTNRDITHKIGSQKSLASVVVDVGLGKVLINCVSEHATSCFLLEVFGGKFCSCLQYHGDKNLDYISFHANEINLFQKLDDTLQGLDPLLDDKISSLFELIVAPSTGSNKEGNMISLAIRIESEIKQPVKQYLLSCLVSQASMNHTFAPPGETWFEQLLEFFDVLDVPILGYEVPAVLTEMHFHVQDSGISYKPKFLSPPLLVLVTIQSLSVSSNIVAFSPQSVLQVIVDNAAVYISNSASVDKDLSFVCVLDVNVLEISLKLCKQNLVPEKKDVKFQIPVVDLVVSNNEVHLHACADSLAALGRLLTYISIDGDLIVGSKPSTEQCSASDKQYQTNNTPNGEVMTNSCESSYSDAVSDLMSDAMQEVEYESREDKKKSMSKSTKTVKSDPTASFPSRFLIPKAEDYPDEEFCIVVDPELESYNQDNEDPNVDYLTNRTIVPKINHFSPVYGKTDQLQAPEHFPIPMQKYTIKELSCKWSIYGGCDFCVSPTNNISSTGKNKGFQDYYSLCNHKQATSGRDHTQLLEIQMLKIRFRHEMYHPSENVSARTIFIIPEFEICDRLESSQINKMLYGFHSESSPKQSHANMFLLKALHSSLPESTHQISECRLFVSLQPLRINIDQDTFDFLTRFFESVNDHSQKQLLSTSHEGEIQLRELQQSSVECSEEPPKVFFKELIFSPNVPIRLDYHGKHVDIEQGTVSGLLKGLGQLHCSQLQLRKIVHRHGILGVDRMLNFVLNEWTEDIVKNQLPSILGGVGPLHSVVQFFQGVHDLIWFPVQQYKRDGRIIKGLQKGSTAFGTSTTTAALELTNRFVCLIQAAAETTYDIVSPATLTGKRGKYTLQTISTHAKRRRQPVDLREGINNALNLVHSGFADTAVTLARVAQQEHNQKGLSGALGGVLRHIPPTLVRPVIIASEATSNVLSGMRNQILPDAQREDELKWRSNEHN